MRNPFRDRTMRATFDAVIKCYREKHKDIWRAPGQARPGNAWANNFWRGYDGVFTPNWDVGSRRTPAYACFRAGQAMRAEDDQAYADAMAEEAYADAHGERS